MIVATVTGLQAWVLVVAALALCGWALWTARRNYLRICAEDAERTRQREATQAVPAFDFHIARRPVASTRSGRAVQPADRASHRRNP